ncbi:TonB-dependent receptor [Campylobacter sp. FMV-PI01]|uniref:TonB-dependent receptor n=1 Tax=Campylobacter portucalensis TaxID=2608384 RepID=A0A6L5WK40_9BACT|nr:TonB-dependent receptor [Campylobacter portucalensis]
MYDINENFSVDAKFGLIDTEYKEYITDKTAKGNKIENTPDYTLSVGLNYHHQSGFYSRLDIYSQGNKYLNAANNEKQNAWVSADLIVGYIYNNLDIYSFIENIGDEEHIEAAFFGRDGAYINYSNPRKFGVGFKYYF